MTEPEELKGEHMASASAYVRIDFKDSSIKPKNLFVKKFTTSAAHTQFTKAMRVMEKESAFFNEFLPKARKFCQKHKGCENLLDFFPKCLYGDDEMVVLENLVLDDTFIMLGKEARQDLFTAKYVLTNLARFHAATYAFIEEECGGSDKFKEDWELVAAEVFIGDHNPMMEPFFDNGTTSCINILKGYPVEGSDEAIETLTGFLGKTYALVKDVLKIAPEDKIRVLNHGDCWNNNMLFKVDPVTGKVNDHIFVDLQITRLGSPNLDLGYFLYTSVKPEIRRQHLKELLQHYFTSLQQTLEKFVIKCPINFEEFVKDYKYKSQLGFFMIIAILSAIGALKEIDIEKMSEDPQEMMDMFNNAINNWVAQNPEKAAEISTEVVDLVKEHEKIHNSGCPL